MLNDETNKVFLNTKGILNDVDEELAEFLGYIENSTDEYASHSKSNLVKEIHERVIEVKQDKRMEVEFMTLLEKDMEKQLYVYHCRFNNLLRQTLNLLEREIVDLQLIQIRMSR